jgi:predicted CXXCH cytochrome family protein
MSRLRRNGRVVLLAALNVAAMIFIMLDVGPAHAGIASTKHNLGTTGTSANHLTAGTEEICVFCHTPHGSDTSAPAPLWNKALPAGSTFTTYSQLGTTSLQAAQAPIGSVSLACLSCHDGTQAMDNMINAPGSGGYNIAGAVPAGDTWTTGAGATQTAGRLNAGVITNIGKDLRNDHPISIQYCGGGIDATGVTTTVSTKSAANCNNKDFRDIKAVLINTTPVFWVDTNAAGGVANRRDKTDIVLYTRAAGDFGTGTQAQPAVECASCHDPHTDANPTFLRVSNTGSAVCLSCHVK